MSLCLVDIHGDIEGDYDIIKDLPRNATNGDVIKALFNCHVQQDSIVTTATLDRHTEFSTKWWNAPYKK